MSLPGLRIYITFEVLLFFQFGFSLKNNKPFKRYFEHFLPQWLWARDDSFIEMGFPKKTFPRCCWSSQNKIYVI